jgi:hypothetical protein
MVLRNKQIPIPGSGWYVQISIPDQPDLCRSFLVSKHSILGHAQELHLGSMRWVVVTEHPLMQHPMETHYNSVVDA